MDILPDVWIAIAVGVFVVLLFVLALLVPRRMAPAPARSMDIKLDDVKSRLDEVERKQNVADHDLRNVRMIVSGLATKESVNAVSLQVSEMRGDMKALVQQSAHTAHSVGRMEDFLMKSTADAIASSKNGDNRG